MQIISSIHRVRASHWSKIKKLYLASWLMNTSPLELLDSAFVWLKSIVKSKWISRKSVKQKWALIQIFTEHCSVFYLLVSNIRPWTCASESENCEKICVLQILKKQNSPAANVNVVAGMSVFASKSVYIFTKSFQRTCPCSHQLLMWSTCCQAGR